MFWDSRTLNPSLNSKLGEEEPGDVPPGCRAPSRVTQGNAAPPGFTHLGLTVKNGLLMSAFKPKRHKSHFNTLRDVNCQNKSSCKEKDKLNIL